MKRELFNRLIENLVEIDTVGTERHGFLEFFIDEVISVDLFEIDLLVDGCIEMEYTSEFGVCGWEKKPFAEIELNIYDAKVYIDEVEQKLSKQQEQRLDKAIISLINIEE